jgi:hypothetical protein
MTRRLDSNDYDTGDELTAGDIVWITNGGTITNDRTTDETLTQDTMIAI